MARPPRPAWTELPAKHKGPRKTPVLGIVLHDTAGTGTHRDTLYLANPGDGRTVSADFTVERDGSIWKLNPDLRAYRTHHAGRATEWRGFKNAQVNSVTVGIEIVQHAGLGLSPIWPAAQVKAVAQLCAWLVREFGLRGADITTHRQIITDGSRSDPRQFPFDGPDGFWIQFWRAYGQDKAFQASFKAARMPID